MLDSGREDSITAAQITSEVRMFVASPRAGTLVHETLHALLRAGEAERDGKIRLDPLARDLVRSVEKERDVFGVVLGVAAAERAEVAEGFVPKVGSLEQALNHIDEELFGTAVSLRVQGRTSLADDELDKLESSPAGRHGITSAKKKAQIREYVRIGVESCLVLQEGRSMK